MKRGSMCATAAAVVVAAFAIAGPPSRAQEATTATTSTTTSTTRMKVPRTTATPEMIAEAIERSKARTRRF